MTSTSTLRTGRDFARVLSSGKRARSDGITVHVARSSQGGSPRLGLSVRTSVGSAVTRNRLKRRVRAAWRDLEATEGVEVVVQANRSAAALRYQELEKHLATALRAAGGIR